MSGGGRCSGTLVGTDVIVTAHHCAPDVDTVPSHVPTHPVRLGDVLTIVGYGCPGADRDHSYPMVRVGAVVELDGSLATLSTFACPGDSGGAVFDRSGMLVGAIIRRRLDSGAAVVSLF